MRSACVRRSRYRLDAGLSPGRAAFRHRPLEESGVAPPPANRTDRVGPAARPALLRFVAPGQPGELGHAPRGLRAHLALSEGRRRLAADSSSALARPWRCSHERGARPGGAGPLEARAVLPGALELVVGEPATGLARCRDRVP